MDAGPIVAQKQITINENDQATQILPHLFQIGTECLIKEVLPNVIAGNVSKDKGSIDQDESLACPANLIDSSEGEICVWKESARTCHNKVRGFSMWPGTFMYFQLGEDEHDNDNDKEEPIKVKIVETRVVEETGFLSGEDITNLVELLPVKGKGLKVVCFDGSILEVLRVQPVTKKVMDVKSFVNGLQGKKIRWVEKNAD